MNPIQDIDVSDESHFAVRSTPDLSDKPLGEGGLFPYWFCLPFELNVFTHMRNL